MTNFKEINPPPPSGHILTAAQVQSGPPIEPLTRVLIYDDAEWEKFIDEWASSCLKQQYKKVLRFSGANDRGIDVAGFTDDQHLLGVWDNYQCKHYGTPITPGTAWPEIGKILWHSFNGHYKPPRAYYFVAPRGTGTTLTQYLANTPALKNALLAVWNKNVKDEITSTQSVPLDGAFTEYVDAFDFSIFKPLAIRQVIEQHRASPYFIPRFGGGLPPRPAVAAPPDEIQGGESVYVGHLFAAYADHTKTEVPNYAALKPHKVLEDHFKRQRECFYHAESMRVFVRDKVEPGTFESLQDEIYHSVVDVCDGDHTDGVARVNAVAETAQHLPLDAHPLGPSTFVRDRRGICHQLANKDRLKWTK
jgi:hypothetical protein